MRFRTASGRPAISSGSPTSTAIYLPLVLSAILPIVTAASKPSIDSWVSIIVNVAAWIVFVVDLAVHVRLVRATSVRRSASSTSSW